MNNSELLIQHDVGLKQYNTFMINEKGETFLHIRSLQDLAKSISYFPFTIIGGGSNVLIAGAIKTVAYCDIQMPPVCYKETDAAWYVTVGAGYNRDDFVQRTLDQGYYGLENLALIPGSVGGGVLGNIGAYGKEVSAYVDFVEYVDCEKCQKKYLGKQGELEDHILNEIVRISRDECRFAYRRSLFKQNPSRFISSCAFVFPKSSQKYIVDVAYPDIQRVLIERGIESSGLHPKELYEIIVGIRQSKLPSLGDIGTAGSFFKNPVVPRSEFERILQIDGALKYYEIDTNQYKIPAGYLLEAIGYKGKWYDQPSGGKVGCYKNQALIVVNDGATGPEVYAFTESIKEKVFEVYGITLENEVVLLGNEK